MRSENRRPRGARVLMRAKVRSAVNRVALRLVRSVNERRADRVRCVTRPRTWKALPACTEDVGLAKLANAGARDVRLAAPAVAGATDRSRTSIAANAMRGRRRPDTATSPGARRTGAKATGAGPPAGGHVHRATNRNGEEARALHVAPAAALERHAGGRDEAAADAERATGVGHPHEPTD